MPPFNRTPSRSPTQGLRRRVLPAPGEGRPLHWLPIRDLLPHHRERVLQHLMDLDAPSRRLRFGHAASDAQLTAYVEQLDFDRDAMFGVFDRRLRLLAFAHLALPPIESSEPADFGVSVLTRGRGRGIGSRLFEHALALARAAGSRHLAIHALTDNHAMLRIALRAGAQIEISGNEALGLVRLPAADRAAAWQLRWTRQAGEIDYRFKRDCRRCSRLVGDLAAFAGRNRLH